MHSAPSSLATSNLSALRSQLSAAQREFNTLSLQPGESLFDFEHRVKRHSDKLLSLKIAEQVQQEQIEQSARSAVEKKLSDPL